MLTRQSLGVSRGSNDFGMGVCAGRGSNDVILTRELLGVNGGSNHVDTGVAGVNGV